MAYKCCLLEHYSQNFASILCCETDKEIASIIENMTGRDIDMFRSLPSYKDMLLSYPKKEPKTEIKDENEIKKEDTDICHDKLFPNIKSDKDFKKFILDRIRSLKNATETFNIFVDALYNITS